MKRITPCARQKHLTSKKLDGKGNISDNFRTGGTERGKGRQFSCCCSDDSLAYNVEFARLIVPSVFVSDSAAQAKREDDSHKLEKWRKKTHLCTPPFEKSPITIHRFHVLPPLKNHPSKAIGFVYSPLWKITHHNPSVPCTPPFEKSSIKSHRFCVLPPLKNHPSQPIGSMYSPLWKMTVFGGCFLRGGRLFRQIRYADLQRLQRSFRNESIIYLNQANPDGDSNDGRRVLLDKGLNASDAALWKRNDFNKFLESVWKKWKHEDHIEKCGQWKTCKINGPISLKSSLTIPSDDSEHFNMKRMQFHKNDAMFWWTNRNHTTHSVAVRVDGARRRWSVPIVLSTLGILQLQVGLVAELAAKRRGLLLLTGVTGCVWGAVQEIGVVRRAATFELWRKSDEFLRSSQWILLGILHCCTKKKTESFLMKNKPRSVEKIPEDSKWLWGFWRKKFVPKSKDFASAEWKVEF